MEFGLGSYGFGLLAGLSLDAFAMRVADHPDSSPTAHREAETAKAHRG